MYYCNTSRCGVRTFWFGPLLAFRYLRSIDLHRIVLRLVAREDFRDFKMHWLRGGHIYQTQRTLNHDR